MLVTITDRYSLWLVPEGAVADALQAVIDRLAREYGGPAFPPHVTLFGSLEIAEDDVVARSRRLAGQIAPFTVHLDGLDVGDTFFQSLFATVRATPELLAAREAAQRTFPEVSASQFRPHLSLLYGAPSPETKQAIIEALRGTLPASFPAQLLVVNRTGRSVDDWRDALRAGLTG
jgi:2'-5' RNA ligase